MPLHLFHPLVAEWFRSRLGEPTPPQQQGWPAIAAGRHTLIAAPTGSGKTLAAFLCAIDRLVRLGLQGRLPEGQVEVLYVSPLKALSSDVRRNLEEPLGELVHRAAEQGLLLPPIRVGLRTGDTPPAERQALARRPPHILVTTPESLYLCLTSRKARLGLQAVRTVIVDEIHALVPSKRGSHLALSLERLDALCRQAGSPEPVRIGLSATQRPIEEVARFLVGAGRVAADGTPDCCIVDAGQRRNMDLEVLLPADELGAVCTSAQWEDVHDQLAALIAAHRTTLVFVSTRRLCERTAHSLAQRLGEDAVVAHHGSMSRRLRQQVETRLRAGQLRAVVATASLELGIDIGAVDLVCQIGSPRAIATLLQRVGRAHHRPEGAAERSPPRGESEARQAEGTEASSDLAGAAGPWPLKDQQASVRGSAVGPPALPLPRGRVFALTRDELVECAALLRAVRRGEFDLLHMPEAPLDVLAQQICALCSVEAWQEDELYALCRRAWPYRTLARSAFDQVVTLLCEGVATRRGRRGAHLHRDAVARRLRGRRGAHQAAVQNAGTIPEPSEYEVISEPDGAVVGRVEEDWAVESHPGDVFLLGTTSWRIRSVRGGCVYVENAHGAPPTVPFWLGEAPGRTFELSQAVSALRRDIEEQLRRLLPGPEAAPADRLAPLGAWIAQECGLSEAAAQTMALYLGGAYATLGRLPTCEQLVAERFFDEGGGMQLVLHMPFGARINRALGLALRKRFCRCFNFELQAAATDDGVVLSLGEAHSFPVESVWQFLQPESIRHVLEQAVLGSPLFAPHFRWTAQRALALLRRRNGARLPPQILRMQAEDLLAAIFPAQAACPENLPGGDLAIPDHPLVRETLRECLEDVMDLPGLQRLLCGIQTGAVRVFGLDTPEPSLLSHQILNAAPYAFLDDAPLEERRARAVALRRGLPVELVPGGQLDPRAVAQVRQEAWPQARDADELHDALLTLGYLPETQVPPAWQASGGMFTQLVAARRLCRLQTEHLSAWVPTERAGRVRRLFLCTGNAVRLVPEPPPPFGACDEDDAEVLALEVVRGWMMCTGPQRSEELAQMLGLPEPLVQAALCRLEAEGQVLRGSFSPGSGPGRTEFCDRHLLGRIHHLTRQRLRREIEPVSPALFMRFLFRWQHLHPGTQLSGPAGLRLLVGQLQGFEAGAGAWEEEILPARLAAYDPLWLDGLCLSGEVAWGRLRPPVAELRRGLVRAAPMCLWLRADEAWLLPAGPQEALPLSPLAAEILAVLDRRGASFQAELCAATGAPLEAVREALGELTACGLVAADGFAGLRALLGGPTTGAGRWARLGTGASIPLQERQLAWARQYLRRYGVVLREVLVRETVGPCFREVLPALRLLEARGEIRAGHFLAGLTGEQFALPEALEGLRALRRQLGETPPLEEMEVSAADPLNLAGILLPGPRVPAMPARRVRYRQGVPVGLDAMP
ncbi:MAG: DEAD/DEAH box helicase [Myxococcales bacterium]|nr:DEAD/DEAH box helicase [Myxococcota bacterium]MDW8280598.1 DEAD/DEAH box helicase [Myxococcales bacterium]